MKQLSIMIKPASAACNLRCKYCFYTDVADRRDTRYYGVMPLEQMRRMLQNLQPQFAPGDRVNFAFQGGEPTLAGLQWFRSFTDITEQWDAGIEVRFRPMPRPWMKTGAGILPKRNILWVSLWICCRNAMMTPGSMPPETGRFSAAFMPWSC